MDPLVEVEMEREMEEVGVSSVEDGGFWGAEWMSLERMGGKEKDWREN